MLIGRFIVIFPILAIAGSFAAKKTVPTSLGHVPDRHRPVRRPADRRGRHRRRADLLPGAGARPDRRALRPAGRQLSRAGCEYDQHRPDHTAAGLLDPEIVSRARVEAFRKLNPRHDRGATPSCS